MQASLLSTLAPLQHLTSLTLCLLNLQAFPLHTQGHPGIEHPAQIEEAVAAAEIEKAEDASEIEEAEDASKIEEAEEPAQIAEAEGREAELTSPPPGGVQPSYTFSTHSTASSNPPALMEDGLGNGLSTGSANSGCAPGFVEDLTDDSSSVDPPALIEDGPDVDVDVEEAQHASHEAPDVTALLPLAHSLRVLRLEQCVMRHRALDQLCRCRCCGLSAYKSIGIEKYEMLT
ncbi:hypothetical protein DUNSADRAFT_15953, partial [Dunaliella salina]